MKRVILVVAGSAALLAGCASDFRREGDLKKALASPDLRGFVEEFADHPVAPTHAAWGTTAVANVPMHDDRPYPDNSSQFVDAAMRYCQAHGGAAEWINQPPTLWCQNATQQGLLEFGLQVLAGPPDLEGVDAVRYLSRDPAVVQTAFTAAMQLDYAYHFPFEQHDKHVATVDPAESAARRQAETAELLKAPGVLVCQQRMGMQYVGETVGVDATRIRVAVKRAEVVASDGTVLAADPRDTLPDDDWDDPSNWRPCPKDTAPASGLYSSIPATTSSAPGPSEGVPP